jgi:hypothetical protein
MQLKVGPFYLFWKPPQADFNDLLDKCPRQAHLLLCFSCYFISLSSSPNCAAPRCRRLPFNFSHVGITQQALPVKAELEKEGWILDHHRVQVHTARGAAVPLKHSCRKLA